MKTLIDERCSRDENVDISVVLNHRRLTVEKREEVKDYMIDLIIKKMKVQSYSDYTIEHNNKLKTHNNDDKILNTNDFLENEQDQEENIKFSEPGTSQRSNRSNRKVRPLDCSLEMTNGKNNMDTSVSKMLPNFAQDGSQ